MKNFIFGILILCFSNIALAKADNNIKYFDVSQFPNIPANVKEAIKRKKCQVPQAFMPKVPHNIVKGNFANKTSNDWAILCSNGEKSSIFVVWESGTPCPSELALKVDKDFLQQMSEKDFQYSRYLSSASEETIQEHAKAYGGPLPKKLDHQGIDDAFLEKASVTFYCENGKWLSLRGAD